MKRHRDDPVSIELSFFEGCASYRTAWIDLLDVVTELDADVVVRPVDVGDSFGALTKPFGGSPTILV